MAAKQIFGTLRNNVNSCLLRKNDAVDFISFFFSPKRCVSFIWTITTTTTKIVKNKILVPTGPPCSVKGGSACIAFFRENFYHARVYIIPRDTDARGYSHIQIYGDVLLKWVTFSQEIFRDMGPSFWKKIPTWVHFPQLSKWLVFVVIDP